MLLVLPEEGFGFASPQEHTQHRKKDWGENMDVSRCIVKRTLQTPRGRGPQQLDFVAGVGGWGTLYLEV